MRVFALTVGDRSRASSRLRVWDHLDWLRAQGHAVRIDYVMPPGITRMTARAALRIIGRWPSWIVQLLRAERVLVQESLLLAPLLRLPKRLRRGRVLFDFSDPVDTIGSGWRNLFQRWGFFATVRGSDHVIAENGSYVRDLGEKGVSISQFYGPVDVDRYQHHALQVAASRGAGSAGERTLQIGWTGSPGTLSFIAPLFPVLDRLARQHRIELVLMGVTACEYRFDHLSVRLLPWTEDGEFTHVPEFDLGLFALDGSERSKRRGAGKLFVYMAAGVPFVASAVGIAADLMQETGIGFAVRDPSEWESVLDRAIVDGETRARFSVEGVRQATGMLSYQAYRRDLQKRWLS